MLIPLQSDRYGFDEPSGNFQQYNYGKGGKQGDGAIINVQDGTSDNDVRLSIFRPFNHALCLFFCILGILRNSTPTFTT